jgi:hypothetical protein
MASLRAEFRENRNENQISGNRSHRWQPLATIGQGDECRCPGQSANLTPSDSRRHLLADARPELRIRRLGVRIPPSALHKSTSERRLLDVGSE